MIKEKKLQCFELDRSRISYNYRSENTNGYQENYNDYFARFCTQFNGMLNEYMTQNGIPVSITTDTYSYKIGFLKKATTTCTIVWNAEKPKDFRQLIIIPAPFADGSNGIQIGWYGESKAFRLLKKFNKGVDRQNKSADRLDRYAENDYSSVSTVLGEAAKNRIQGAMNRHTEKKYDERLAVEAGYESMIRQTVIYLINYYGAIAI